MLAQPTIYDNLLFSGGGFSRVKVPPSSFWLFSIEGLQLTSESIVISILLFHLLDSFTKLASSDSGVRLP